MRKFGVLSFVVASLFLLTTAAAQEVTLRFVFMAGVYGDAFEVLKEDFEAANPDIGIELQGIPYNQFMQTMTTRILGGDAPDVAYVLDRWANAFAGQGVLVPLDDRVPDDYISQLLDFHWGEFEYQGAHIGVPLTFNIQSLVINKTALDAAGIDIPQTFEDAWTWNDLIEVGRQLKEAGVVRFPFSHWPNSTPSRLSQYLVAEGGSILTPDLSAPNLDNDVTREMLAEIQTTFEEELVPPDNWATPGEIWPLFLSGQIGIQVAGGNFSKASIDQAMVDFDWTYSIMPTTLGTANPLIMFEQSEHPEEVWRFIEFLMQPESVLKLAEISSNLPARQDLGVDALAAAFGDDAAKMQLLMTEQTKGITPTILNEMSSPAWSEIDLFLRGKLEELSLGVITPDQFIEESSPEIERILATYN
ncbi:MAG: sugar ABC transporter substrate-binding protein [Truepera sp.]|nr:sugar ABC transporter substrate-binding protein [Truepera sp.]